jgi:hypothetical protein
MDSGLSLQYIFTAHAALDSFPMIIMSNSDSYLAPDELRPQKWRILA